MSALLVAERKSHIAEDAMLIAASWAALFISIANPELQLILFGVALSGVAVLKWSRKVKPRLFNYHETICPG